MPIEIEKKEKIMAIFKKFLINRANTIRKLKISDLNVNPFLIRMISKELSFNDIEDIVKWLVNQRLERGTVTAFGLALQNAAKVFSEGTGVEGADILKNKHGTHYHIQIKSGPNTVPKDMAVRITQLLQSAQRRNRGSIALFGMCYGNINQVSSIVQKYVGVDWIVGKEFWEFISDDPNCIYKIYDIANRISDSFLDSDGKTLKDILDLKIKELTEEFKRLYGSWGDKMWEELLNLNS